MGDSAEEIVVLPEQRCIIHALQGINRLLMRVYHRLDVLSPAHLPKTGPAIVVCNHTSGLDPLLIQSCCPRAIVWMMAREFYETPVLRNVLDLAGTIPVTRSGRDMKAMRLAMRALERGQILGLFPEGKIELTRELLPFQTGVALMAIKTAAPIYPAYLDGTQRGKDMVASILRPQHALIHFGPEVIFDRTNSRENLTPATQTIFASIHTLQQETAKPRRRNGL